MSGTNIFYVSKVKLALIHYQLDDKLSFNMTPGYVSANGCKACDILSSVFNCYGGLNCSMKRLLSWLFNWVPNRGECIDFCLSGNVACCCQLHAISLPAIFYRLKCCFPNKVTAANFKKMLSLLNVAKYNFSNFNNE